MGVLEQRFALERCARSVRSVFGQRAFLRSEALHAALAVNPHLSEDVWMALWASKPRVSVAASLAAHCPSADAVLAVVRREQRKRVLLSLVRSADVPLDQAVELTRRRGFDADVASAWVESGRVPAALAREVATVGGVPAVLAWGLRFEPSDVELAGLLARVTPARFCPLPSFPVAVQLASLLEARPGLSSELVRTGVLSLVAAAMQSRHVFDPELMLLALAAADVACASGGLPDTAAAAVCHELVLNPNTPLVVLERVAERYALWGSVLSWEHRSALERRMAWPYGVSVAWDRAVDPRDRVLLEVFAGHRAVRGEVAGVGRRRPAVGSVSLSSSSHQVDWLGLAALRVLAGPNVPAALELIEPLLDADGGQAWDSFLLLIEVGGADCTLGELVAAAQLL